ncbi:MAG: hypothetical protein FK733_10675 [Asgard group archaeon]|nr:hypothetical protein [Asgard group archaeon]
MNQEVLIKTSLTPNILMHIFSCLEIEGSFYDSDYGLKHHFTILKEEYEEWEVLAKKCMTLGCNAELYAILFQIPSYIPAEDIDMILETYTKISDAVSEGSFELFLNSYPEVFDSLQVYAPLSIFEAHFKTLSEQKEIIVSLITLFKQILHGVWDRFYKNYWESEIQEKIMERIESLNVILSPFNLISIWQKQLKLDYPYQEFVTHIVEPTTTIATTLLAENIMLSMKKEDFELYKIIIHEIGRAFILNARIFENETLKSIAQTNVDKLGQIVDAICIHMKTKIYQMLKIKSKNDDPYKLPIVNEIMPIFIQIWEAMEDKNIYQAIIETYNKLSPVV